MPITKLVFDIGVDFSASFIVNCDKDGNVNLKDHIIAETVVALKYCDAVERGLTQANEEAFGFIRRVARISLKSLLVQCNTKIAENQLMSDYFSKDEQKKIADIVESGVLKDIDLTKL